jgi:hypothetical protein
VIGSSLLSESRSYKFLTCGLKAFVLTVLLLGVSKVLAQEIPSPQAVLKFHPTTERTIADWKQITDYFSKLDDASERVLVKRIGETTLGRQMIAVFISDAENIRQLEKYRQISAKLANPKLPLTTPTQGIEKPHSLASYRGDGELSVQELDVVADLIEQGKVIVAISCSIHSTEIVASQMSMNLAYSLAAAKDTETLEILRNVILILIPSANPDGIDIVAEWYRKTLNTKSEGTNPPELYHFYAGHDNNRDWFMMNLKETRNITKLFWQEWFPQIVYDIHQMGQNGARFIIPPFYDPPNPRIPPSIIREVGLIGYKIAADLQAANFAGVATNAVFDMWWHGGFRSAPYYHNSIGILSEAASANLMSPVQINLEQLERTRPARGLNSPLEFAINHPNPWRGGVWRPEDIAEMQMISSRAVLEMASKFRKKYLRLFYSLNKANLFRNSDEPVAFVVTAGQPNAEAVSRFLEILMWQGIEVYEMTEEGHFAIDKDKRNDFYDFPLGSFLIFVNQPQKNNILSLLEKQVYPNRVNQNGEAEPPYDVAGWTLPLQMGIECQPIWEIRDIESFRKTLRKIETINQARKTLNLSPNKEPFAKIANPLKTKPQIGIYKSFVPSMDEGWTRFVLDTFQIPFSSVFNKDFQSGNLNFDVLIFPSDSEEVILRGLSGERYPSEFAGGISEKGLENLKKFVENGGKIICFDASCELIIKTFDLPIKNVLKGLKRSEFYNPGSIVEIRLDKTSRLTDKLPERLPAYFINSSAYEITDTRSIKPIAFYAEKNALLSGWMLGEKFLNGKVALAEASYGRGKIVLFAFRPQHRGQTFATFPLIFNALELEK